MKAAPAAQTADLLLPDAEFAVTRRAPEEMQALRESVSRCLFHGSLLYRMSAHESAAEGGVFPPESFDLVICNRAVMTLE